MECFDSFPKKFRTTRDKLSKKIRIILLRRLSRKKKVGDYELNHPKPK